MAGSSLKTKSEVIKDLGFFCTANPDIFTNLCQLIHKNEIFYGITPKISLNAMHFMIY